jgi:hypothetical protein
MKRDIQSQQRHVQKWFCHVDGSAVGGGTATTDGLTQYDEGTTITENSSGNYTVTLPAGVQRILAVQVTPLTDVTTCRVVAIDANAGTVQIEQVGADQTTPTADGDFFVEITTSDAADRT